MKLTEILRLVWLNLSANKSKIILTSTGIIVGAATIMLVIAIGTGGREEVAEQLILLMNIRAAAPEARMALEEECREAVGLAAD